MNLDWNQRNNIGLQYLMHQLSPGSAYGQTALGKLLPCRPDQKEKLQQTLDNVEKTLNAMPALGTAYARLSHLLMGIKDLRQTMATAKMSVLSEIELFELKRYLIQLEDIGQLFSKINETARYEGIAFAPTADALKLLDVEGNRVASFQISSLFSTELAATRREKKSLEEKIRQTTDDAALAELRQRRQTVAAAEQEQESAVRLQLTEQLQPYLDAMLANTVAIEELDLLLQRAALAARGQTAKPEIDADTLTLTGMTNPMIADLLAERGQPFTPVDITLTEGTTAITGANMGGKSVALKTVALGVWLAHCGFYVFAQAAKIPLFDELFLVSADLEAVDRGLSSFGGEICRLNEIVAAVRKSYCLVLLDEFARGTNPVEGAALAQAVADYFNDKKVIAVMTTHYDGVAALANRHYQVRGLRDWNIDDADIYRLKDAEKMDLIAQNMNYGLVEVAKDDEIMREALTVCKLLNLDRKIVERTRNLLTTDNKMIE